MADVIKDSVIDRLLHKVQKPARYTGGEYGSFRKGDSDLDILISYPDLYEVGMSNMSIKLLYRILNGTEGVSCERVFTPDTDMEELLRREKIPLFSLESKRPLKSFDIVAFSIGYELTLTNLLNILDLGGIPPLRDDRKHDDPIIIAGGPGIMNPVPFSHFVDCFFFGEAEEWIKNTLPKLVRIKRQKGSREDILHLLRSGESIWFPGKSGVTGRSFYSNFSTESQPSPMLVPNIKVVQDHGVVEIMRGCPNNCRFCSATYFYRPYRQKDIATIIRDVDEQIFGSGYREVTLSSLSSGDFHGIEKLMDILNKRYGTAGVSFSFPSLRVDSFMLELLGKLSVVRKSGLTFAIETPLEELQRSINKMVAYDKIVENLRAAREKGWRNAKFYFMIGLPEKGRDTKNLEIETRSIIDFLNDISLATRMKINVNIATFIPKPHTPLQWARQIDEGEALKSIYRIKSEINKKYITIRFHSPFLSFLEGIIARGDERAGQLFYQAFRKGARFDAWDDRVDRKLWEDIIEKSEWDIKKETLRKRELEENLPWDPINIGSTKSYLKREYENYINNKISEGCYYPCRNYCGVCKKNIRVINGEFSFNGKGIGAIDNLKLPVKKEKRTRVIFSFEKKGNAIFLSHLNIMSIFERALMRASLFPEMTGGFNPKPRLEFANPLSLGIYSEDEVASVFLLGKIDPSHFTEAINRVLPDGLKIRKAACIDIPEQLPDRSRKKQISLMSTYWGSDFTIFFTDSDDTAALKKNVTTRLREYSSEIEIEKNNLSLSFHLRLENAKGENIKKILKVFDSSEREHIRISRKKTYARREDGSRCSYLERFSPVP